MSDFVFDPYLSAQQMPPQQLTMDPQYFNVNMVTPIGRFLNCDVAKPRSIKQKDGKVNDPKFAITLLMAAGTQEKPIVADLYRAVAMIANGKVPSINRPDPTNPNQMVQMTGEQLLQIDPQLGRPALSPARRQQNVDERSGEERDISRRLVHQREHVSGDERWHAAGTAAVRRAQQPMWAGSVLPWLLRAGHGSGRLVRHQRQQGCDVLSARRAVRQTRRAAVVVRRIRCGARRFRGGGCVARGRAAGGRGGSELWSTSSGCRASGWVWSRAGGWVWSRASGWLRGTAAAGGTGRVYSSAAAGSAAGGGCSSSGRLIFQCYGAALRSGPDVFQ